MAKQIATKGLTGRDQVAGWIMTAGFTLVLLGFAQTLALPAHFV